MKIRSLRHRGLRAFIENGDAKGIRQDQVARIRHVIEALIYAANMGEVGGPPGWRIHQLTGDRAGMWRHFRFRELA